MNGNPSARQGLLTLRCFSLNSLIFTSIASPLVIQLEASENLNYLQLLNSICGIRENTPPYIFKVHYLENLTRRMFTMFGQMFTMYSRLPAFVLDTVKVTVSESERLLHPNKNLRFASIYFPPDSEERESDGSSNHFTDSRLPGGGCGGHGPRILR